MAVQAIQSRDLTVKSVEAKPGSRNPSPPFMTSTLQQEASRKFGFGARQTMSVAQRLYEAGLITYMRTDGIDMAPEAVTDARKAIADKFGDKYLPKEPRIYKNKAKNAQEAHECIRPTEMNVDTAAAKISDSDQRKLYDLIYKRTMAAQMEAARLERTTVEIGSDDGQVVLRSTGQVMLFDGFLAVYEEGRDDDRGRRGRQAPAATVPRRQDCQGKRDTRPALYPATAPLHRGDTGQEDGRTRYRASLDLCQHRHDDSGSRLCRKGQEPPDPAGQGAAGDGLPDELFPQVYRLRLHRRSWKTSWTRSARACGVQEVLVRFWRDFSAAIAETSDLRITEVLEKINEVLEPHLFPPTEDGSDPRLCPNCGQGRLSMRTARAGGAFIGCSNYPECRYTRPFGPPNPEAEASAIPPEASFWARIRATRSAYSRAALAPSPARRDDGRKQEAAAPVDPQRVGA